MDILSQATEKIAQEAYRQYARILEDDPRPVYYGRVLYERLPVEPLDDFAISFFLRVQ